MKSKSDFSKNILTLMTGTALAQAIPIAISPILTRIYTPEDFGLLGFFLAIASVLTVVVNGRYELAIMLPEKEEDALTIFKLGFFINSIISLFLLLVVFFANDLLTAVIGFEEISSWLYFLPISVFLSGLFNSLQYYNNRLRDYSLIRNAVVSRSIVLSAIQLAMGLIKQGVLGLVVGHILSGLAGIFGLGKSIYLKRMAIKKITTNKIFEKMKEFSDFPKYSMMAGLANTLSNSCNSLLIPAFFNVATLGYYSLVERVLGAPSSLISTSVGSVLYQAVNEKRLSAGNVFNIFKRTTLTLVLISLSIFAPLFFVVEFFFSLVFGEEWRIAGTYARYLIPVFAVRFVVSPLTVINQAFRRNKIIMLWQIGLLVLYGLLMFFAFKLQFEFESYLILLSVVISVYYFYYYYLIFSFVRRV